MSIGDRQPSLLVLRNGKTVRHAARAQLFGPAQIGRCCKLAVKLPALKDLGQLGDHLPVVVIDSREQAPFIFTPSAVRRRDAEIRFRRPTLGPYD
jgi:hypothetical protein